MPLAGELRDLKREIRISEPEANLKLEFLNDEFLAGRTGEVVIPIRRSAERDLAVARDAFQFERSVDYKSEVPRRLRGSG